MDGVGADEAASNRNTFFIFFTCMVNFGIMFCPECKAEYLPGVTCCSDCNVALVDHLPESGLDSGGGIPDSKLQGVWRGEDQYDCVSICERLRVAGIPFKVVQHTRQFLKGVEDRYQIGVPPEFCTRAKEIIEGDRVDFSDEASDRVAMELPVDESNADAAETHVQRGTHKWNSKSATVSICSQSTLKYALMIEASLRENYIHCRVDVLSNGSRNILVMPEDEHRAREIVREIKYGVPPT